MPLPLGHTAIGIAAYDICHGEHLSRRNWKTILTVTFLANLPDIDVLIGLIAENNGYVFHRGPTHSLLFVFLAAGLVVAATRMFQQLPVFSYRMSVVLILSHLLADFIFTNFPVSFFWPLQVYWSSGLGGWTDVIGTVFFDAAQDAGIVIVCVGVMFANRIVRQHFWDLYRRIVAVPSTVGTSAKLRKTGSKTKI